ncbi:autotransporter outer membrane beta-barrel domain-containing protein [uncultured Phascolarctobacterium sp.]|uniref:autotransporter outer membrane beta-barrel domain-containing protein n=1 Tax=uncultured Phascolarctobacterium sp. TaxID=512296 RepID=UPI0025CC8EE3|nr:autotransporter outer membrane beta-barrel domain-containing protein [uncultured Phascolarctobacterium sp.]
MYSYTDGTSSYNRGTGDNSSKSINFYTTQMGSKGHYLDVVFKVSNMDNDFNVYDTNSNKITGDANNTGVSLSAEYGRKNDLKHGWYIEPQAQFTLGYLGGDNYFTSNGIEVSQSGIKSAVGRIGFNIGKEVGSRGIVYAKANLLHEFGGGYDVTMSDSSGQLKTSDTFNDIWFEYGVGAAVATGKNSHIYLDVERSAGSDFTKDWQWNVGARWTF